VRGGDGSEISMTKPKAARPQVYDFEGRPHDATMGVCSRCGKRAYIAMHGAGRKTCFECFAELEARWRR
jgi:ribosomal protein S27AE